jgi:hypothetical protein
MYLTAADATPAYELLGVKGLVMDDEKPQLDNAYIDGNIGFRYHHGGHTDAPDWPAFFQFSARFVPATELAIDRHNLMLTPEAASSAQIAVTANSPWQATVDAGADWLQVQPAQADGSSTLTIRTQPNATSAGREASVTIASKGSKQTLYVVQASNQRGLKTDSQGIIAAGTKSEAVTLNVGSNTAWSVESSSPWLTVDNPAGINTGVVTLHTALNPTVAERAAILTVRSPLESVRIPVVQEGGTPQLAIFGNPAVKFDAKGGNRSLYVNTNFDPTITTDAEWATARLNRQGMFTQLVVRVEPNTTGRSRTAQIKLSGLGTAGINITVNQDTE